MARLMQVYARPSLCTGCRICANACALAHNGEVNPRLGAIRIKQNLFERYEYQEICRHCDDAPCIDACMVGCIKKDTLTGAVIQDQSKCVGCLMCVMVCPYGGIRKDPRKNVAFKCDRCLGREIPVCVDVCPTGALAFAERED